MPLRSLPQHADHAGYRSFPIDATIPLRTPQSGEG